MNWIPSRGEVLNTQPLVPIILYYQQPAINGEISDKSVQFGNRTSKYFFLESITRLHLTFVVYQIRHVIVRLSKHIYIVTLKRQDWSWPIVRITL